MTFNFGSQTETTKVSEVQIKVQDLMDYFGVNKLACSLVLYKQGYDKNDSDGKHPMQPGDMIYIRWEQTEHGEVTPAVEPTLSKIFNVPLTQTQWGSGKAP